MTSIFENSSYSLSQDDTHSQDDLNDNEQFKGALKITRIKNRRYIRMPNFPKRSVNLLKNWLNQHLENPYPTHKEKDALSKESGLSKRQIQNWFTNARKRIWQPMIREKQESQTKENIKTEKEDIDNEVETTHTTEQKDIIESAPKTSPQLNELPQQQIILNQHIQLPIVPIYIPPQQFLMNQQTQTQSFGDHSSYRQVSFPFQTNQMNQVQFLPQSSPQNNSDLVVPIAKRPNIPLFQSLAQQQSPSNILQQQYLLNKFQIGNFIYQNSIFAKPSLLQQNRQVSPNQINYLQSINNSQMFRQTNDSTQP